MNRAGVPLLLLLIWISCTNPKTPAPAPKENRQSTANRILNGIELQAKSVTVSQAYLVYADDETLVPPTNAVPVNQPVKLRLLIAKGWIEHKGRVQLGASETIATHDGQVLLHEKDLFRNEKQLDANDAHLIQLTAAITYAKRKLEYVVVSFRIWDKNGPGEIQGHYRLYIQ